MEAGILGDSILGGNVFFIVAFEWKKTHTEGKRMDKVNYLVEEWRRGVACNTVAKFV